MKKLLFFCAFSKKYDSTGFVKCSIVIPARIGSVRFPRKVLANLCGKPIVQHVYENAKAAKITDDISILTDSEDIANVVKSFGGKVLMTSADCKCGADRIASVIDKIDGDLVINVQGDEPLLRPDIIAEVAKLANRSSASIFTPVYKIREQSELDNPNRVKVAVGANMRAVYFSRSPIPFLRDVEKSQWLKKADFWGHIGVYGYIRSVLENYKNFKPSILEQYESLEQLRFLENGYSIDVVVVESSSIGIDFPSDLQIAEEMLRMRQ